MKWHRKNTSFGIWDDEERRVAVIVQDHPNEAMNSRLIAAVPQMLEALEIVRREMYLFGGRITTECSLIVDSAIAAANGPAREPTRSQMISDLDAQLLAETERAAIARRNEERVCGICKRNSDGKNTLEDGRPVCSSCEEMLID